MSCEECKRVIRRVYQDGEIELLCRLGTHRSKVVVECSEYEAKEIVVEMPVSFSGMPEMVREAEASLVMVEPVKKRGRPWKK